MKQGDQVIVRATITNLYQSGEVMLQLQTGQSVLTDQALLEPAIIERVLAEGEALLGGATNLEGKVILDRAEHDALIATRDQIGVLPDDANPDDAKPRAATWLEERANWEKEVEQLRSQLAAKPEGDTAKAATLVVDAQPTAKDLAKKAVDEAQAKLDAATSAQAKTAAKKKLDTAKAALEAIGE